MFLCSNIIHDYIGINEIIYPKVTHEHVTVRYFLGYHTPYIIYKACSGSKAIRIVWSIDIAALDLLMTMRM